MSEDPDPGAAGDATPTRLFTIRWIEPPALLAVHRDETAVLRNVLDIYRALADSNVHYWGATDLPTLRTIRELQGANLIAPLIAHAGLHLAEQR